MSGRVGIITQVRMTSTRLPGKVLKEAKGQPLLKYHTDRLKQSSIPVFIATTVNPADDPIIEFAKKEGIVFYKGSEHDVLSRFYGCAKENDLDIIVRVTSDCPLIDGLLIKDAVDKYKETENSDLYLSNALERTFPRGFDFEIFSFKLLSEAHEKAVLDLDKEHVTPYINRNRSGKVSFFHYRQEKDKSAFRITVDTAEDYQLVKILIEKFDADKLQHKEITDILEKNPDLVLINAHIEQKKS
jgi:spore coat polysaccharide biosynthesis protein SpsF